MERYLFLDIDGVLNDHAFLPGSSFCGIRPDMMARLNRVIEKTRCRIVVSSSWRYVVHGGSMTITGLEYLLITHGLMPMPAGLSGLLGWKNRIVGVTRRDYSGDGPPERVRQILDYVREAAWLPHQWAAVDNQVLDFGDLKDRFVQTDGKTGLTDAGADRLIHLLGG